MWEYLLLALGLALLYKGADYLVDGASALARKYGVSPLVIGLTIVAFGTSMPELVVNVFAAIKGDAEITFGNVLGSNIANILLILGICAAITPVALQNSTIWKEIPFALLASVVLFIMSNREHIAGHNVEVMSRSDGMLLIAFFIIFLYYTFGMMKDGKMKSDARARKKSITPKIISIIGGLVALFIGGYLTVESAISIARSFGVSELLISATIVAVGTSLPELVTSVVAVLKKQMDMSVGNIVGSNIFNIFFIMGVSSIISPLTVPAAINLHLLFSVLATVLLFAFMFYGTRHKLDRWQGVTFLCIYAAYITVIIVSG